MKKFLIPFLVIIFVALLTILLLLVSMNTSYSKWEKSFEREINPAYLIDKNSKLENIVSDKIDKYTLSQDEVENLQLKPDEVAYILFTMLSKYNSGGFEFSKIYVHPQRYNWDICAQISFKRNNLTPWICMDLNKDNVQTAQLYITDVRVGPFSIGKWGGMVNKINSGIANSLLTVNENGFSGRYFENIELLDTSIVIKGSQY